MHHSGLSFVDKDGSYDPATYKRGIRILRDVIGHGRDRDKWQGRSALPPHLREPMQVEVVAPYTSNFSIGVKSSRAQASGLAVRSEG